jgi:hypothetical protein
MDYVEDLIREKIINEIKYLELPNNWNPEQVIKYIIHRIDRNNNV